MGVRWLDDLAQDTQYAARSFLRAPGFTLVAVLSLALAIAANSTLFSAVHTILIRRLPYPDSDRLVAILYRPLRQHGIVHRSSSEADLGRWRRDNTVFEHIEESSWGKDETALSGAGQPERVTVQYATDGLLPLLGVRPFLGRFDAVAISYEFWQRRFGGDRRILGRTFYVDSGTVSVTAVLPAGFDLFGTGPPDILKTTLSGDPSDTGRWLMAIGKLKSGITMAQAQASMDGVAARLAQIYPETNQDLGIMLAPLNEALFGRSGRILYPLFGAVAFVLLIACTNIACLMLARGSTRRKEMGIRTALGAGRFRSIRQVLAESVLLGFAGGCLGLVLSIWGIKAFIALAPPGLPLTKAMGVNLAVAGFTFALSVLTGLAFGLAPALQGSRADLNDLLKEGGRGSTIGLRHRTQSALVVTEVALALVLLASAGLMVNTVIRVLHVQPGFHPERLMTVEIRLTGDKYFQGDKAGDIATPEVSVFCRQVLERLRALPGVQSAALIDWLPMIAEADRLDTNFTVPGQAATAGERSSAMFSAISPQYFHVMQIPVLSGRDVTEQDTEQAPWVVVINAAAARRFWPNQDPVGRVIRLITEDTYVAPNEERTRRIVGVVGNVRQVRMGEDPVPEIYIPYAQQTRHFSPGSTEQRFHKSLVLRTSADPKYVMEAVRKAVVDVDNESPVFGLRTVRETISDSTKLERFYAELLSGFAAVALLLAAIGIYGVVSYSISARRHEIGLRMALGAQSAQVLQLVIRHGFVLSAAGAATGLAASFGATPLVARFLYGVKPHDPLTLAVVTLFPIIIGLVASLIPARRAIAVDPMVVLRHE